MRYGVVLLLGLLLGGGAAIFFLGAPRTKSAPGVRVKPPDQNGDPPGTVVITLNQSFFDNVLAAVFSGLEAPTFRLAQDNQPADTPSRPVSLQGSCTDTVTLLPEANGVKTSVQFAGGRVSAPMAFNGSYNLLGNCMQFKGWAQTNIQLSFDQTQQTLFGQVSVDGVNLEGVSPVANNFITVFVQNAINQKVNPLVLLGERQLSLQVPVKASNGAVKARVKDVRAEVLDGSLKLHVTYEFSATRGQQETG